jgi:hypothetical protein
MFTECPQNNPIFFAQFSFILGVKKDVVDEDNDELVKN